MRSEAIYPSLTNTDHVILLARNQQQEVCRYFQWTAEQYCTHQLDEYEAFLNRTFLGYPSAMLNEVRYSPIMAGYWKNEWISRNEKEFILLARDLLNEQMYIDQNGRLETHVPSSFDLANCYDEYLWIHSARRLVMDEKFVRGFNEVLRLIRQEK